MLPDGVSPVPGQMCLYAYRDATGEIVFSRHADGVTVLGQSSPPGGRGLQRATLAALARLYGPIEVYEPVACDEPDVRAFWEAARAEGVVASLQDEDGHEWPAVLLRLDRAA